MIKVNAPDRRDVLVEALRSTSLRAGIIGAAVAPGLPKLGPVIRAMLAPIGWSTMDPGDRQVDSRSLIVGSARLRAAGVDHVVLTQAGWLPSRLVAPLASAFELAGITLFVICHPNWTRTAASRFDDWVVDEWEWDQFKSWRAKRWSSPAVDQHPLESDSSRPIHGLPLPIRVHALRSPTRQGDRWSAELRARITAAASYEEAAIAVADAVRHSGADLSVRIPAIVEALETRSLRLVSSIDHGEVGASMWRDLRRVGSAAAAAAIVLASIGVSTSEMIRLEVRHISPSADEVRLGQRAVQIPFGARPFVAAHVGVRTSEVTRPHRPLFAGSADLALDERSLRRLVVAGEHATGWHVDEDRVGSWSSADRQLRQLGLALEGNLSPIYDLEQWEATEARRCRHGLPTTIQAGRVALSHSRVMCEAGSVQDTRRWAPEYEFEPTGSSDLGSSWMVRHSEGPSGWIWAIRTPLGTVWLQSMAGQPPTIASIADAVREVQRRRLLTTGHARRRPGAAASVPI